MLINLDGVISPTATISILDRSFLYGDSIYEVVRTFRGKVFGLPEHLGRLRQSADYLYMPVPWSDAEITNRVEATVAAAINQAVGTEFYIRIVVSRGADTTINLLPSPDLQPGLIIVVSAIAPEPVLSETGLHLCLVERQRNPKAALNPSAKTGNYLNNILGLLEAKQQGADDALMLNPQGEITEATTSNLWIVKGGVVYTPPVEVGILHGITRYFLLKIMQEQGIACQEVVLKPEDLWDAEEAFLSSSVRLLMPVNQLDSYKLPHCPGKLTRKLWDELLVIMAAQA